MLTVDEAINTAEAMSVLATTKTQEKDWAEIAVMLKELKQFKEFCNGSAMKTSLEKEYKQGRADAIEELRDKMTYHQNGLSGYLTISIDEWEQVKGAE